MPIDKRVNSAAEALADVADGATVLISGFGGAGFANMLIRALRDRGAKNLTLVVNSATHRYSRTHGSRPVSCARSFARPHAATTRSPRRSSDFGWRTRSIWSACHRAPLPN